MSLASAPGLSIELGLVELLHVVLGSVGVGVGGGGVGLGRAGSVSTGGGTCAWHQVKFAYDRCGGVGYYHRPATTTAAPTTALPTPPHYP